MQQHHYVPDSSGKFASAFSAFCRLRAHTHSRASFISAGLTPPKKKLHCLVEQLDSPDAKALLRHLESNGGKFRLDVEFDFDAINLDDGTRDTNDAPVQFQDTQRLLWLAAMPLHVRENTQLWTHPDNFGVGQIILHSYRRTNLDPNVQLNAWTAIPPFTAAAYSRRAASRDTVVDATSFFRDRNGSRSHSMWQTGIDFTQELKHSDLVHRLSAPLIDGYAFADNEHAVASGQPYTVRAIEFAQKDDPPLRFRDTAYIVPNCRLHYLLVRATRDLIIVLPVMLFLDDTGNVAVLAEKSTMRIGNPVPTVFSNNPRPDHTPVHTIFSELTSRINVASRLGARGLFNKHTSYPSSPALIGSTASGIINANFASGFNATQVVVDERAWNWAQCDGFQSKSTRGLTMAPIPFSIFMAHCLLHRLTNFPPSTYLSLDFRQNALNAWETLNMNYLEEPAIEHAEGDAYATRVYHRAHYLASCTMLVDSIKDAAANWTFSRSDVSSATAIANSRLVLPVVDLRVQTPPNQGTGVEEQMATLTISPTKPENAEPAADPIEIPKFPSLF